MNKSPDVDEHFKRFLVSYRHDGSSWVIELQAKDAADAEARLARIAYATVEGEIAMTLPASAGWLAKLLVPIRNALRAGG